MSEVTIGRLDRRLTLQSMSRTADGAGGASVAWSLVAEVWGAVTGVSGAERMDAEGLKGQVTHQVRIRHRDGVSPGMRFLFGTRELDIRAVIEIGGRRRFLKCMCEERVE